MKNLSIRNILWLPLLIMLMCGCNKSFLDLAPLSNSNVNNFFKTKADFDLAVTNAYSTLYTIYAPKGSMSFTGELMSDNTTVSTLAISGSFTIVDQQAFSTYSIVSTNTGAYNFWVDHYTSLYQVNIILQKIGEVDLGDNSYENRIEGEMKFLRALYYFNLVRLYGDVPLITVPVEGQDAYNIGRTPAGEVYNQVVADLQFAAANLPEPGSEPAKGRATKGAAKTLLGKVYLTIGNKPAAATILQEVYSTYNGTKYDLLPDFQSLWGNTNAFKNTKESIFEIQYTGGVGNPYSTFWTAFQPFENGAFLGQAGGMNMVTDDLYNEYEPGDVRREISFYTGYTRGETFIPSKFNKKWVDLTAPLDGG
ncbi:MAG: RagB/SusD family nutrient uptake outer membrane protein, partial [Niabella sp.]